MIYWKNARPGDQLLLESIKILLNDHDKLLIFLFHPSDARLNDSGDRLLKKARCFSSGEYVLIKMALDFWDGSGNALFSDVYSTLDGSLYHQVLLAIEHLKGRRSIKSVTFNRAN